MNKLDLLKKLKLLADDVRGNENERQSAEEQLNKLMRKYNISEEDLEIEKVSRRDFYFKDDWEHRLICQTIYKLWPEMNIYKSFKKRNWIWAEMTDVQYLEFELHYCAYKASFQKEFELFYYAFLSKNRIFPDKPVKNNSKGNEMSKGDLIRASMMAEGIESVQIRRLLNGENK